MGRSRTVAGLAFVAGVVWALARTPQPVLAPPAPAPVAPPAPEPAAPPVVRTRSLRRRIATSLTLTVVFFAGAALAAGAGNELVSVTSSPDAVAVADDTATAVTDTATTTDETTTRTTTTTAATTTDEGTTTLAATTTADAAPAQDPADATPVPVTPPTPPVTQTTTTTTTTTTAPHAAHHVAAAPPATARTAAAASPFPVVPFDAQAWLADHPGTALGNAAVAIAQHFLGVPYTWGGNRPATGFDCSGLTQYVYAQLGVWLPHYAAAQFLMYPRLDPSDLAPGDLVFFEPKADGPGHVAIYVGGGQVVEAPHTGADVRVNTVADLAAALGYLGAVRPTASPAPFAQVAAPAPGRAVDGRFIAV